RFSRDWSSDVCSSDLQLEQLQAQNKELQEQVDSYSAENLAEENKKLKEQVRELIAYKKDKEKEEKMNVIDKFDSKLTSEEKQSRSEERRVGKECIYWR